MLQLLKKAFLVRAGQTQARTWWLATAALFVVALGFEALGHRAGADHHASDAQLLKGRIWLDHLPTKDTDHVEVFVALDEGSIGVFQKSSAYEGAFEVFKHEPRGEGKIELLFPQTKKKVDVGYDAKRCKEKDFDYCLSLSGAPRGVSKYFSRDGWEIEATDVADLERKVTAWEAKSLPVESD